MPGIKLTTKKAVAKKATPKPTPKPKAVVKAPVKAVPKKTPIPKFTAPSVAEFRKSAAYKTESMDYKEYVDTAYDLYKSRYKIK
jgi:hypothetical protein